MQTPRGALAPEFRSSGRPTKWGDRQQHRSDWDDSPAAVRTLPGTLRKLLLSLATRRGGRCLAGWQFRLRQMRKEFVLDFFEARLACRSIFAWSLEMGHGAYRGSG